MPLIDPRILEALMAQPDVGLLSNVGDVINAKDRFLSRERGTEGARMYRGGGGGEVIDMPQAPERGLSRMLSDLQPTTRIETKPPANPFAGMDEGRWGNMTIEQREQWLRDLQGFKGWDTLE